ncbi:MAG: ORF6N domain-containing protein [Anaerolineales bacterium]|nr:ORF6N domain-containing protein [Anaerolineales bacterium]
MPTNLIAVESVAQRILLLRGQKVMLDADLAELFGVPTKRFNEQVKRNFDRFPADFMFQLTEDEYKSLRSQNATLNKYEPLRSQFVTLKTGRGQHRKYLPYVFTEHGAIMAATILNSPKAVEMSVFIVRAFVQLREMLSSNAELAAKLLELEHKVSGHDQAIAGLIDAIRQLMMPAAGKSRPIGFTADIEGDVK